CVWAAVLVGVIVDIRAQFNMHMIQELGLWVRGVELVFLPDDVIGWEHHLSKSRLITSAITPFVRLGHPTLTWILFALAVGFFVVQARTSPSMDVLLVGAAALPACILLFAVAGVNFPYGEARRVSPATYYAALATFYSA